MNNDNEYECELVNFDEEYEDARWIRTLKAIGCAMISLPLSIVCIAFVWLFFAVFGEI